MSLGPGMESRGKATAARPGQSPSGQAQGPVLADDRRARAERGHGGLRTGTDGRGGASPPRGQEPTSRKGV